MMHTTQKLYSIVLLMALSLLVTACNSESNNGSVQNSGETGSVAILLTDAPIDEFDQFLLTVTEMSLLGDDGAVSLFSGSETIDLLNLQSHSDLFSLTDNIPAGSYYKIRMQVSDPQLIRLDMHGNVEEAVVPNMGGNGKLDLNPRGDIVVVAGEAVALQVDLDVEKSIHLIQNGNGAYRFRPVVFVDILDERVSGKLVRLSGYVDDVEADSFELCSQTDGTRDYQPERGRDDYPDEDGNRHEDDDHHDTRCVDIYTGNQTAYFDGMGNVVEMPSLQEDDAVTVLGYYRSMGDRRIGLDAEIVELAAGDVYQPFMGMIDNIDADNHLFVLRDQQDQLTTVMFHPETKVFSMLGEPLSLEDLTLDMTVKVEGVYDEIENLVKAAVIFVDTSSERVEQLAGNVLSLHNDLMGFEMTGTYGDVCVAVDENTNLYLLSSIENGSFTSEAVGFSELQSRRYLEVYGAFNLMGCFVAENIILLRTLPEIP